MESRDYIFFGFLPVALVAASHLYFRIADRFSILDKPNLRSSHYKPVVRGGGIIFIVGLLLWFFWYGFTWPWFLAGLTAAAAISFADDVKSQPAGVRFAIHLFAVGTIFYSVGLFSWPLGLWLLALVVSIGAMNAFNFMDGINGITGVYSMVSLLTFFIINRFFYSFTEETFILTAAVAVAVFLFFNFRTKARCFAGDVGSVTIAFVLIFLLLQLIYVTNNLLWVILFLVYGIDSVITIVYRLKRKENIFKPHRTHLYQYLCNELRMAHKTVSLYYGIVQLLINSILVYSIVSGKSVVAFGVAFVVLGVYLYLRAGVTKRIHV